MEKMILYAIIVSLITTGIYSATWKSMLLYNFRVFIKNETPEWLYKPFCGCLICMSSCYSVLFWLFVRPYDILFLPAFILMVAGINTILTAIISPIIPEDEDENK